MDLILTQGIHVTVEAKGGNENKHCAHVVLYIPSVGKSENRGNRPTQRPAQRQTTLRQRCTARTAHGIGDQILEEITRAKTTRGRTPRLVAGKVSRTSLYAAQAEVKKSDPTVTRERTGRNPYVPYAEAATRSSKSTLLPSQRTYPDPIRISVACTAYNPRLSPDVVITQRSETEKLRGPWAL